MGRGRGVPGIEEHPLRSSRPALWRAIALAAALALATAPAHAANGAAPALPRIIGGIPASDGQLTFAAGLVARASVTGGLFCGGAVVAPQAVLTAAHCVAGATGTELDVIVGRATLSSSAGQRIAVAAIQVDPGFNPDTDQHDAAVLQLAQPATVPPLALAPPGLGPPAPGTALAVAGWGQTVNGGPASDTLQWGVVQALPDRPCADTYGPAFDPAVMLCAGSPTGTPDTCRGDSGGPLLARAGDQVQEVAIVAYGGPECGTSSYPGVYTRVDAEWPWIASVLGQAPRAPVPVSPVMPGAAPVSTAGPLHVAVQRVTCGLRRCQVIVALSGAQGRVARVLVRTKASGSCLRRGGCPGRRRHALFAHRVQAGLWSATAPRLPLGHLSVTASAFDGEGHALASPARTAVTLPQL